jgi:hypothetical protein
LRDGLPRVLARGNGDELRVWMHKHESHEFFARVTGRADDADFHDVKGVSMHPRAQQRQITK